MAVSQQQQFSLISDERDRNSELMQGGCCFVLFGSVKNQLVEAYNFIPFPYNKMIPVSIVKA